MSYNYSTVWRVNAPTMDQKGKGGQRGHKNKRAKTRQTGRTSIKKHKQTSQWGWKRWVWWGPHKQMECSTNRFIANRSYMWTEGKGQWEWRQHEMIVDCHLNWLEGSKPNWLKDDQWAENWEWQWGMQCWMSPGALGGANFVDIYLNSYGK